MGYSLFTKVNIYLAWIPTIRSTERLKLQVIRIQIAGGLGNQLFIWAGAHNLYQEFGKPIKLISTIDANAREDRPVELQELSALCSHGIVIENSRFYGFLLRTIDKLRLEKFVISRRALREMGIYTFHNPTSTPNFSFGRPLLIRCYFQRTDIVELHWDSWSRELIEALRNTDISNLDLIEPSNAIHFRRGDFMSLSQSHGALSDDFFQKNLTSILPTYICTDERSLKEATVERLKPKAVLTPREANAWQTLKVFCNSANFLGSNSTLSWWAGFLRAKNGQGMSSLPNPWTQMDFGYEEALRIPDVDYVRAEFLNA